MGIGNEWDEEQQQLQQEQDYRKWNQRSLTDLTSCVARGDCGVNQRKVAILGNDWFVDALVGLSLPLCLWLFVVLFSRSGFSLGVSFDGWTESRGGG